MLRSSTTSYYEADGLGSVTSLSGGAGALAQTYTFDSFGKQTAASGSLTNPFQYTARESDAETGLYYYRARYYDWGCEWRWRLADCDSDGYSEVQRRVIWGSTTSLRGTTCVTKRKEVSGPAATTSPRKTRWPEPVLA